MNPAFEVHLSQQIVLPAIYVNSHYEMETCTEMIATNLNTLSNCEGQNYSRDDSFLPISMQRAAS